MPDKEYYWKHREEILRKNREYQKTPRGRELARQKSARYRARHPERVKETNKKSDLKRKKNPELLKRKRIRNLTKRQPLNPRCWFCPSHRNLQRHHPDYNEPIIYITCCSRCHPYVDESTKEITF